MFVFSKILESLLDPQDLILKLAALAFVLCLLRRQTLARALMAVLLLFFAILSVTPLGGMATAALEDRFPPPAVMPARVDGVVVLGGAVDLGLSAAHGRVAVGPGVQRIVAMAELARRYPQARIIYTGGSGDAFRQDLSEAPLVRKMLVDMGVDVARIQFEGQSRNTRENALESQLLGMPAPGETWLLVTSAAHMPRAMGVFRAVGWNTVAFPVDYRTLSSDRGPVSPSLGWSRQIALLGYSLHEYCGLAYYRLRRWTDTFFPGPDPSSGPAQKPVVDPLSQTGGDM